MSPLLGPHVRLFDARERGLDEDGLREWVREANVASLAAYASRSYCHPYALLAWHGEPVGVDIERVVPCDQAFADSIRTVAERARRIEAADFDAYVISLWCSKEALAKALGDAVRYDPRRLESPLGWPEGRAGPWRATELTLVSDHAAWLCWREAGAWGRYSPSSSSAKVHSAGALSSRNLWNRAPCRIRPPAAWS
jgi:hypothetical protein